MPPPPKKQRPGQTVHTARVIIVVRAAFQGQANEMARVADPTTDGDTFNVGYRRATDTSPTPTVVAYIANWLMTPEQVDRLRAEFGRRFTRTLDVIPPGGDVNGNEQVLLFDAAWGLNNVLGSLGLARMPTNGG